MQAEGVSGSAVSDDCGARRSAQQVSMSLRRQGIICCTELHAKVARFFCSYDESDDINRSIRTDVGSFGRNRCDRSGANRTARSRGCEQERVKPAKP
jgi:hypothetical protein